MASDKYKIVEIVKLRQSLRAAAKRRHNAGHGKRTAAIALATAPVHSSIQLPPPLLLCLHFTFLLLTLPLVMGMFDVTIQ